MTEAERLYAAALDHHRARRLAAAEALYRQILAADPAHADSLHRLGMVAIQTQRAGDGIALIRRAIDAGTAAQQVEFHLTLAAAHRRAGDPAEAERAWRAALALDPASQDARLNLGALLTDLGRAAEAEIEFRAALAAEPTAPALYGLGLSLARQGRSEDAAAQLREAVRLQPGFAPAHGALGTAFQESGDLNGALDSLTRAVAIDPGLTAAAINRAVLLNRLGRFAEAEAACRRLLAHGPDAAALNTLGIALKEQGRLAEACAAYEQALAVAPDHLEARYNLATAWKDQGRTDEAIAGFSDLVARAPDFAPARFAWCMVHLPPLYRDAAEIPRRRADYAAALNALVDHARTAGVGTLAEGVGASQPFYLAYQGRDDLALQRRYGALVCAAMAARYPASALAGPPAPGERIRVGIASGYFRQHANWRLPIRGWVEGLDPGRFELFAYHTGMLCDGETDRAERLCAHFVQGPQPVARWRDRILADRLHILLYPEVGMDPVCAQLAALRLAPVQAVSWGHPTTSGYPTLDHYLSSDLMEPADGDDHYAEHLVRLPGLSTTVALDPAAPPRISRESLGLRSDATVYWCGQSLYKYLPQHDAVFPAIAKGVDDCQFVFLDFPDSPDLTAAFRARLEAAFAAKGLDAACHCHFLPRLTPDAFVAAMAAADVVLDSIGWSGCNSLLDALRHDLPIVTMPGALMRARHGAAILTAIGETRTIACDVADYAAIAVTLGLQPDLRTAIACSLAAGKQTLTDDRSAVAALGMLLERWAAG